MKKPRIYCAVLYLLILLPITNSQAASGWGRVNMQGAVINTACALDIDSRDQTIDLPVLPLKQIERDGKGGVHAFNIRLTNCVLNSMDEDIPRLRRFQMTFDGRVDNGLFGVDGQARGIAIQLADTDGNILSPGETTPLFNIIKDDKKVNYSLRLVRNQQQLRSGSYRSSIRLKMDYY